MRRVVETVLTHGHMPRGYLGVGIQPVRLDPALHEQLGQQSGQQSGLMLMSVEAEGPAAKAGLLQGDVLVTVGGQPMRQMDDLQSLLAGSGGKQVSVRYVRAGSLHETAAQVGQR